MIASDLIFIPLGGQNNGACNQIELPDYGFEKTVLFPMGQVSIAEVCQNESIIWLCFHLAWFLSTEGLIEGSG